MPNHVPIPFLFAHEVKRLFFPRSRLWMIALPLTCQSVQATAANNEAKARQQFVPYVRTYTDCIARAVRGSRASLLLAKQGEWKAAVRPIMPQCDQHGVTMVTMHERIYGAGTGIPFLRGPYLDDLPRALGAKLKPDFDQIDREEAEAQRLRTEQEARAREVQAEREKLVDAVAKEYLSCLQEQVLEIVPYSDESATVIADVVFRKCSNIEEKLNTVVVATTGESKKAVELELGKIKDNTQRELIANIVAARARAEREKRERPAAPTEPAPTIQRL